MLKQNTGIIDAYRNANDKGHTFIIPAAVYYEIRRGLLAVDATVQMRVFKALCASVGVEEMSMDVWEKAAQIWSALRKRGTPLGKDDGDIFIAAQCIVNNYTLVTDNASDFSRIDGLNFIAWTKS
jgi:tRNA(fMet)-specific endonuclease VapC